MKEIKLMNLRLRNFKGIKEFALEVNGEDVKVFGDNATGKTTLYDAFLWLLFNKDSQNKTKFSLKTLTPEGHEMNNMEHEVEASFLIDGQPLVLRKVHYENWTQKRNAIEKKFDGNKNKYEIDGVPTPEGEYNKIVKALIDEEVFKILTSPTYFNEHFKGGKWEKRRELLLEITGDLTDEEVIDANKTLQELTGVLQGRKIEDHKKVIAAKKKKINDEIKSIPTRISEINNMLPEGDVDVSSIEKEIAKIEQQLDEHATQINNIKNGGAIVDLEALSKRLELELREIQNELEAESKEKGFQVQAKIQEEQSNLLNLQRKKVDAAHEINRCKTGIADTESELVNLRNDWTTVNNRSFEGNHNKDTCPTCEQSLPAEQVRAAHDKALNDFNLKKSRDLEKINADGKTLSEKKVGLNENMEVLIKGVETLDPQIEAKEKSILKLESELNSLRDEIKNARQNDPYLSKIHEVEDVNQQIGSLKENAQIAVLDIEKEVVTLRAKRTELNQQIAQQNHFESSIKRIEELELQQEELAKDFENVEKELFLVEEFTRIKVEMLDEKINNKFKIARFKLTRKLVNGSLDDVCETTYNGVPYGSGLNNAAKINVGLDIIRTLSNHYGFKVPIFIDNAEAVTNLIDMDTQVISLVVSEKDKQLRIEKQPETEDYLSVGEKLLAEAQEAI